MDPQQTPEQSAVEPQAAQQARLKARRREEFERLCATGYKVCCG